MPAATMAIYWHPPCTTLLDFVPQLSRAGHLQVQISDSHSQRLFSSSNGSTSRVGIRSDVLGIDGGDVCPFQGRQYAASVLRERLAPNRHRMSGLLAVPLLLRPLQFPRPG